jgi:hypothetical protein
MPDTPASTAPSTTPATSNGLPPAVSSAVEKMHVNLDKLSPVVKNYIIVGLAVLILLLVLSRG